MKDINSSRSKIPPYLALFLLSPAVAELLSGSAPPVEFFNPLVFIILASLYGSGAILARELTFRWRKGYPSLLLLGAAYGVIEEGLMVKSFFDPAWPDLGVLGVFGRWIGVNWVWAEMLIIYHAVFSITIPVLLVEFAYPSQRKECWVGYRALGGFAILLTGVVFLGYFAMTPYRPPLPQYFSAVILAIFFILLAWKVSYEYERQESTKPRGPASFFATGLFGTIGFFIVFWALPNLLSPLGVMFFGGILVFGCARFLKRLKLKGCDDIRRFALASGALLFLIFLAPLQELDKTRPDNPQGMGLVGLAFLIGLLLLGWRVKRRTQTSKQEQLLG